MFMRDSWIDLELTSIHLTSSAPSEAEAPAPVAPVAAGSSGITAPLTSSSGPTSSSNNNNTSASGASHEIQDAKSSGVPVGAAVAGSGIAAAAAGTAVAAGLGHSQPEAHAGGSQEILEAKTSGVPVGAAVARSGIAADAAETAAASGLGHSGSEGVTGVEKVAPNVTQASSSASATGVGSDRGTYRTMDCSGSQRS